MALEIVGAGSEDLEGIRAALEIGNRNEADGFAGLNSEGVLVGTIQQRVGTASEINSLTLADGEIAYVSDLAEWRIGDGATSGGLFNLGRKRYFANVTPVPLTWIPTSPQLISVPVSPQSIYRIIGTVVYLNDSNTESNFRHDISPVGGRWGFLSDPTNTSTASSNIRWHSKYVWAQNGSTGLPGISYNLGQLTAFTSTPPTLVQNAFNITYEITACNHNATNFQFQYLLRLNAVTSAICFYSFSIERVK